MSLPGNDPDAPETDEEYMNALLRGLELAWKNRFDPGDRPPSRLEEEKLCYFAYQELDLPVTYSWYIFGAKAKASGDPQEAPNRMVVPGQQFQRDHGENEYVDRYRQYFESETFFGDYDLEAVRYAPRHEFLQDFYEECAPEEFRDLYLISIEIQRELDSLNERVEMDTGNQSLSAFGAGADVPLRSAQEEQDLRLLISDLHLELADHDELAEIVDDVARATDVVEQVLARLATIESATGEQAKALDNLEEYFYYGPWLYVALYISTQTATGPQSHELIREHANRFLEFDESLQRKRDRMQTRCYNVDLYPTPGHHSEQVDGEQSKHLQEMMRGVLEGSE